MNTMCDDGAGEGKNEKEKDTRWRGDTLGRRDKQGRNEETTKTRK